MRMPEIIQASRASGCYFFAPSSMRFFNCKVHHDDHSQVINETFITSEHSGDYKARYTIRRLVNGSIENVSKFQEYLTLEAAQAHL